jgi:hypothetical protein
MVTTEEKLRKTLLLRLWADEDIDTRRKYQRSGGNKIGKSKEKPLDPKSYRAPFTP